ncbi:hypothetical protein llg_43440 [Luteolibacter sp. LG18]|nr:hypothetical protein llg_07420 [Luteolibacter sp. LG18]BCU79629.1 hypothetical protein llg_43440 [Luteolibacter sp. LG18]
MEISLPAEDYERLLAHLEARQDGKVDQMLAAAALANRSEINIQGNRAALEAVAWLTHTHAVSYFDDSEDAEPILIRVLHPPGHPSARPLQAPGH